MSIALSDFLQDLDGISIPMARFKAPRPRLDSELVPYLIGGAAAVILVWALWSLGEGDEVAVGDENRKNSSLFSGKGRGKGGRRKPSVKVDLQGLDKPSVKDVIDHLVKILESAAENEASAETSEYSLPPFPAQTEHLVSEVKEAKKAGTPLLVEGAPGLGKGTALATWTTSECASRPAIYMKLAEVLNKRHGGSATELDDAEQEELNDNVTTSSEALEDAWQLALARAFGLKGDVISPDDGLEIGHLFSDISQALRLFRPASAAGPPLLVIDDIQLLFHNYLPLDDRYNGIEDAFQWLLQCESEGILDVVFCSSEKSVLAGIRRLRGFDWRLDYRCLESVEDEKVADYLMNTLNPSLKNEQKFDNETAYHFVYNFNGNMLELRRFANQDKPLQEYILERESEHLAYLRSNLPSGDETNLKDIILSMILRNGCLAVHHLERHQLALVEQLVENNFLRWRDSRMKRRESREALNRYGENGLVTRDSDEEEEDVALRNDPFAMFARSGAELAWYNQFVRTVCERWFNEGSAF
ncbi:uncharacterized protein SPPG_01228 [Spizellomyces punctatus DAOM BR117]|uniref:Uncharacterized protein n=1 Tax=Spizellomyces punctatus (strain DAOM BR117) TaxID=645134 RepID=A0A0L0HQW4_SPIPD|nr:uncharacterized protein SPPG_01228 [Spizellomyces punctatus DAOM BR117]KND03771.1 hypothetical protein SPPG_01228 [Spizellomyces punctatus DAOM BR117]|eukprot:XP_016611810.1 hypothetical protein SPPG_01228 [Spizellomyces punctatus DAOM BR117]